MSQKPRKPRKLIHPKKEKKPMDTELAEIDQDVCEIQTESANSLNPLPSAFCLTCGHFLTVHAEKDEEDGLYTMRKGPCHLVENGRRCGCQTAVEEQLQ